MNDLQYLIKQLDLLIGFLDVSDEQIYNQIKNHDRFNLGLTIEQLYEKKFDNFKNHITTSALLLGFTHFEDFLTKCITKYLTNNPDKNDLKVTVKTVIEKGNDLVLETAKEQSRKLTFAEKIKFFEKNLNGIPTHLLNDIKLVNDIRNCLMHHNGCADNRLSPKYSEGQKIVLDSWEINGYGLKARNLAEEIWKRI